MPRVASAKVATSCFTIAANAPPESWPTSMRSARTMHAAPAGVDSLSADSSAARVASATSPADSFDGKATTVADGDGVRRRFGEHVSHIVRGRPRPLGGSATPHSLHVLIGIATPQVQVGHPQRGRP